MKLTELFIRLSSILFLLGFALLLWPGLMVFVGASAISLLVALVVLYVCIDDPRQLRISWLLAATLLVAYGGGSFSTYLNATSAQDFEILTKERPIELISSALALVDIISGLMLLVGWLERPAIAALAETKAAGFFGVVLSCCGLGLIITGYLLGDLGYMGIQTDSLGRVSVLGAIANLIAGPLAGMAGHAVARSRGLLSKAFHATVVVLISLAMVPTGRRAIVIVLMVATIGFALGGGLRRLSIVQKTAVVAVGACFTYVMSSYFFALRLATWELGTASRLQDQLWLGLEFMLSPSLSDRFSAMFYDNIRERTFVLGYLADLMEAVSSSGPLYGDALIYYFRLLVPSLLDPTKDQVMSYRMIEALAHPKLGLAVIDQANTILTDGTTDFSIVGAVVYSAALLALMSGALWVIQKLTSPITVLFGSFTIIGLMLKPELTLDEYLVPLRNLAALLPLLWIVEALPGIRLARHSNPGSEGASNARPKPQI